MKYVLMFCDSPDLYGQIDDVAAEVGPRGDLGLVR